MKLFTIGIVFLIACSTADVQAAPTVDVLADTVGSLTGGLLGTLDTLLGGNRRQQEQHIHIYVEQPHQQQQQPFATTYHVHSGQTPLVQTAPVQPQLQHFLPTAAPVNSYNTQLRLSTLPKNNK